MVTIKKLGYAGHETFEDLTPEEAEKLIDQLEIKDGQRYFVMDMETKKLLKEIKLQENQKIALIPVVRGG